MEKTWILAAVLTLASAGLARAQQPTDAAAVYARECASCHGPKGTPNAAMGRAMGIPNLAAASEAAVPDSVLRNAILNGKGRGMPAYKARLKSEEVAALVAYLRAFSRH